MHNISVEDVDRFLGGDTGDDAGRGRGGGVNISKASRSSGGSSGGTSKGSRAKSGGKAKSNDAESALRLAQKMGNLAKNINNDRLNELIAETEKALAIIQDEGALSMDELDKLKGLYCDHIHCVRKRCNPENDFIFYFRGCTHSFLCKRCFTKRIAGMCCIRF